MATSIDADAEWMPFRSRSSPGATPSVAATSTGSLKPPLSVEQPAEAADFASAPPRRGPHQR